MQIFSREIDTKRALQYEHLFHQTSDISPQPYSYSQTTKSRGREIF